MTPSISEKSFHPNKDEDVVLSQDLSAKVSPVSEAINHEDRSVRADDYEEKTVSPARLVSEENDDDGVSHRDVEAQAACQTGDGPIFSIFSSRQKRFILFMVAWGGFFSGVSANIYFPVLNQLAEVFHVNHAVINLTLTSYMICQGLAPTIFGDLADMAGRRPAYAIGFTVYICANIGIALSNSFAELLVFRCLQSTGSSSMIALASGIVGDIATSSERGSWNGWAVTGPMISPALGPVLGGVLSEYLGWRSVFWFLVIMAVAYLVPFLILFPETGRNVVGNGSIPPPLLNMSLLNYLANRKATRNAPAFTRAESRESQLATRAALAERRKLRWPNPLNSMKMLAEKDMGILLFFNAIVFCAFYDVTASAPSMFAETYDFNDLEIGLAFLPFGAGCLLAPTTSGRLLDWNYRRVAKQAGIAVNKTRETNLDVFPIEKARLFVAVPFVLLGNAAVLSFGWALDAETHVAAPLIMMFLVGWSYSVSFNCMSTTMVDYYPDAPATAIAANNLCRCELGAGATAVIIYMIEAMGRGWCFTLIAGVVTALTPILWVLQKWGPKWREERRLKKLNHATGYARG